jgi:glycosyltransferase involved in cell wall biosynthesis
MDAVKKILLIIDNLGSGGAQNQLTLLAIELKKKGYDISVFTYYAQDFFKYRLTDSGVTHISSQKSGKLGLNVVKNLIHLFNKNKYDTVISFLDTPNFYTCLASTFAKHKPKIIVSYRSKSDLKQMSLLKKKQKEWVNKTADAIVANSHHERERWQKSDLKQANKWNTIYNAVDTNRFKPDINPKNSHSFLVIGSVGPAKNGLIVIEALAELKKKGIIIPLTWIGQKVRQIPNRRDYIAKMERKIDAYGLTDQWTWKEPTISIEKEYKNYKALILASNREGLPNVVCEAMCCGLPCIVSEVLDHPKLVRNNESGFLFNPDDPSTLSEVFIKLNALSSVEYKKMSRKAREYGLQMFDATTFVTRYEELLK